MLTFEQAIQRRVEERQEIEKARLGMLRKEDREQAQRELGAIEGFKVWLSGAYGFDAGTLTVEAIEYVNEKGVFEIKVEIDQGYVTCMAPFKPSDGMHKTRTNAIWHAVRREGGYYDYENFLDAAVYAQGAE